MAYYLGREVKVYIAHEADAMSELYVHDTTLQMDEGATDAKQFATARGSAMAAGAQVTDLTGCDLSIGVTDEDVSFMGLRQVLKAEIKKETTLSLTRKKGNAVWDVTFNGDSTNKYRWGISGAFTGGSTANVYTGLEKPTQNSGYRLHIQLASSPAEIFCIRNATITGHTVSLNADGTTEETMEFLSNVDPKIVAAVHTTETPVADLQVKDG